MGALRRYWLLIAALAAGPGCAYNPGYFPYYFPGGHIKQEHAKPGGLGYFRNFDPKACKLDVTPQNATAPLGSQIVLVATVSDKDGQPRRSRRVEWVLEGPGNIVEADESGFYAGRGYKVDNKYAVGYTGYVSKTITRGNDDPKDDTTIAAGQTFCVISSAVPGETVVTAYAPEVFNWDAGRVVVKVCWGDGRFAFPPAAVVRPGGEHALTTTVTKFDQDGPQPPNYRVRYRVLDTTDGAPAVLVGRGPGGSAAVAEADVDTNGAATVVLRQQDAKPGRTRVAVEVVKPSDTGGPGTVVSRRETVIEWAVPQVRLDVKAPASAGLTATVPVAVAVTNPGSVESGPVRVRIGLSDGATLERSEPPPVRQDAGGYVFDLPAATAGQRQEVALSVKPAKLGQIAVRAEAVTADDVRAENRAVIRVEAGKLHLVLEAPPVALSAERIAVRAAVTNAGASPAANVSVWVPLDPGLSHASGQNPVQITVGTLAAGETKTLDVPLTAKGTGRYPLRATATADGDVTAAAEAVTIDVRKAELSAAIAGPKLAYLDQDFTWTVTVGNPGDASVSGVAVRASLPAEVRLKEASDGGRVTPGTVEWTLPELRPGDKKELKLTASGAKLAAQAKLSVIAQGDALSGRGEAARTVGDPVQAKAESAVAVIGTPAVVLELVAPAGPVEVGKKVSFQVRVINRGTVSARGVEVAAFAPAELKPVRGTGKSDGRIDGGKVTFAAVDELRPGESAVFAVESEAAAAGDARFRAEVRAGHLNNPLREEQSVRVVGK